MVQVAPGADAGDVHWRIDLMGRRYVDDGTACWMSVGSSPAASKTCGACADATLPTLAIGAMMIARTRATLTPTTAHDASSLVSSQRLISAQHASRSAEAPPPTAVTSSIRTCTPAPIGWRCTVTTPGCRQG